jgi:two-component system NtrC family sensor kinase
MKTHRSTQINKKASFRNLGKGFHALSHQILHLANQGLLRPHLQQEVSKMIIDFSGCDAVELWLKDHDKYIRCRAHRHPEGTVSSEIMPCAQNENGEMLPDSKDDPNLFYLCRDILLGQPDLSQPGFKKSGSYWLNATKKLPSLHLKQNKKSYLHGLNSKGVYPSLALIPLRVDRQNIGLLQLKSKRKKFFSEDDIELYEDLAQDIGIALAHRDAQVDLRERVKELTCLYSIARLAAQPDLSTKEILQGIVKVLPPAWLYPEIAHARIILNGVSFSTPGFREGRYQQRANILSNGKHWGSIEVVYGEERPELDEGPFLREERALLDAIAKEIANILIGRQAEQDKLNLEEQVRHADRLATIGQLAAGVAHELNEPLGSILGFAQLAKKCPGLPHQAELDIEKISHASLHARDIVKKLLIFARQMPPQKIKVNVNQLVEEVLNFFKSRCSKEGVELTCSLSPNLPEVDADLSQLNQVVVNLIVNALQAMPQGGDLKIQTLYEDNQVLLIVEDTGIGMNEEVLEKIFTPFFTTKEVGKGTGLGLPVVHGIITFHGGSVRVKSKVGKGTRFEIQLPIAKSSISEPR